MRLPRRFCEIMCVLPNKEMVLTSGLLDQVNGQLGPLPQEYVPYPVDDIAPGFVWKSAMFPSNSDALPFNEDEQKVTSGFIPARRTITRLL